MYSIQRPDWALRAVQAALQEGDLGSVHDLIDPVLTTGIDRSEFVRMAGERLARIGYPDATSQPIGPPPGAKSVDWRAEQYREGDAQMARVRLLGKPAEQTFETFIQRGAGWYWRPKPEYTVWPIAAPAPASQPESP